MHKLKLFYLIAIILCSNNVIAQRAINWYRVLSDTTELNYNPFSSTNTIKMGYYNINPINGKQHRHIGNGVWVEDSLFKGQETNITINGTAIEYSPEQFGAVRQNLTFAQLGISQSTINSNYPGINATISDNVDWAAWQMAIKLATSNGGTVKAKGGIYYLGPKSLTIEKYSKYFEIDGGYSKLVSTGSLPILNRPSPNDNGDANVMVDLRCTFRNLVLKGTSNQIGIDIGPSYGAYYQNILGESLKECIHLRFALRTTIENCFATNCNIGWIADRGNWAGSTNFNSQSNHTTFRSCRYFGSGDMAFGIIAASGCVVEDCIIEGSSVRAGIDFNGQGSTVVKDFTVKNTHFECTNGASEAFIKIRIHSGLITIDKVFGQYASILADIGATTGYVTAEISHVSYWVAKNGKFFNNANNVGWILTYNENPLTTNTPTTTVPTWFNGTSVQNCGGPGCGSNRFSYIGIPR
jgi:hypothetical protein